MLYANERYGLSLYVSGLAVEALLRAFQWHRDPAFDGRHNLLRLFKASGVGEAQEARLLRRGLNPNDVRKAMVELLSSRDNIIRLWSNDYRYATEAQIRARLRALGEQHSKRGNQIKPVALTVYNSAKTLIDVGTMLWTSEKK
ncbi:MAG: hypothetical protein WD872_01530 [Pirellulaceae bacterium]